MFLQVSVILFRGVWCYFLSSPMFVPVGGMVPGGYGPGGVVYGVWYTFLSTDIYW